MRMRTFVGRVAIGITLCGQVAAQECESRREALEAWNSYSRHLQDYRARVVSYIAEDDGQATDYLHQEIMYSPSAGLYMSMSHGSSLAPPHPSSRRETSALLVLPDAVIIARPDKRLIWKELLPPGALPMRVLQNAWPWVTGCAEWEAGSRARSRFGGRELSIRSALGSPEYYVIEDGPTHLQIGSHAGDLIELSKQNGYALARRRVWSPEGKRTMLDVWIMSWEKIEGMTVPSLALMCDPSPGSLSHKRLVWVSLQECKIGGAGVSRLDLFFRPGTLEWNKMSQEYTQIVPGGLDYLSELGADLASDARKTAARLPEGTQQRVLSSRWLVGLLGLGLGIIASWIVAYGVKRRAI